MRAENIVIDIHGVLDANPNFFVKEAFNVLGNGGTVHIVTGAPWSDALEKELLSYSNGMKYWTHFYSLTTHLEVYDLPRFRCSKGRLWCHRDEDWDKIKGWYCQKNDIHRIYDDTIEYRKWMPTTTNFFLYSHNPTAHEEKLKSKHLTRPPVHTNIKAPK